MRLKLVWAAELIHEATQENRELKQEIEELLLENDRFRLQLEQKKTQLALECEKRAENELKMKREIRFLLEACIKAKNDDQEEEDY